MLFFFPNIKLVPSLSCFRIYIAFPITSQSPNAGLTYRTLHTLVAMDFSPLIGLLDTSDHPPYKRAHLLSYHFSTQPTSTERSSSNPRS